MKFVCDEGVERQIVHHLRVAGHDVDYIAEISPSISDEQVLAHARNEKALLITSDKDFGELIVRLGRATSGVLLLRLSGASIEDKVHLVGVTITDHSVELLNAFSVLTATNLRIRKAK